jgi:hypothetical protein
MTPPRLPVPDAVELAKECNRAEFLLAALISAKSPITECGVWELCIAFLRVLGDSGAPGGWRVANLILWLSFWEIGNIHYPILTIKDICIWTGHSERSARRHLNGLIARGFIARRARSRISTRPGDEYSIPEPVLIETRAMLEKLFPPPETIQ